MRAGCRRPNRPRLCSSPVSIIVAKLESALSRLREPLPLLALLAAGAALRIFTSAVYRPAALNQWDSASYISSAQHGIFDSVHLAPGYPLFLDVVHRVSDQLAVTISIQHLLGLATGALLWLTVRSLTGSRWLGLIPAAVVVLGGDQIFLEHTIASEALFTLFLAATFYAAVRALDSPRAGRWLLAAGVLLGAAVWVRFVALALLPLLVGWAFVAFRPRLRAGLRAAACVAAPAAGAIALIVVLQGAATGFYGLNEASGWGIYARVAPFADCERFDPPPGTRALCQPDGEDRPPPDYYAWDGRSPAHQLFGKPPKGAEQLGEWGRAALLAQPADYLAAVGRDLSLLVAEERWINGDRFMLGPRSISFELRTPDQFCGPETCQPPKKGLEAFNQFAWSDPDDPFYAPFAQSTHSGVYRLQQYQRIFRVHPPLLGLLVLIALLGLLAVRGRLAKAQWLLGAGALILLVFPIATTTYNIRYTVPALALLATAGALAPASLREGAGWLRGRPADRVSGGSPAASSPPSPGAA